MNNIIKLAALLIFTGFLWSCNDDPSNPINTLPNTIEYTEFSKAIQNSDEVVQYEITIENLSPQTGPGASQPFSPPVLATHKPPLRMFKFNSYASNELRFIAEDAVNTHMLNLLNQSNDVFDVVEGGGVILPGDTAKFLITAKRGHHKLSMVSMLVNTNDGFTGVDKLNLPEEGSQMYYLRAFDAGTEKNTEMTDHIPGPCCGNPLVRIPTHERIRYHAGIKGIGNIDPLTYGWNEPVAKLTVTRINMVTENFSEDSKALSK